MRREWSEYDWGKWMSAVISRAARALTDTHSRWMTLIWEITECILTPRPSYRATITPDRWIGLSPTNHTARTVDTHTHKCTRTPTHTHNFLTEWTDCSFCVTFCVFDIEIHLESGVSRICAKRAGSKGVDGDKRNQFNFNSSSRHERARVCVSVATCTHSMHVRRHTNLSVKERPACTVFSLCSACHIFH